jgi:membrane-associated phospholipid phosphatase
MKLARYLRLVPALLAGATAIACGGDSITAPVAPTDIAASVAGPKAGRQTTVASQLASVRWNAVARKAVAEENVDPPMASRYYALLSVAQQSAVEAVERATRTPAGSQRPALIRAAVISASTEILAYEFPARAASLRAMERDELATLSARGGGSELSAPLQLGADAARSVILRAATDGADAAWTPDVPSGPGKWLFDPAAGYPLRPTWRSVRPWLMTSGGQFRPVPPPAFTSDAYRTALDEVRQISDTRTAEQLRITLYWADGAGTSTPPGHWNAIASDLAERYHLDEERATRMFASLNMALMDAGIGCWDAKYTYWLIRPSQADPAITTPVGLPNFPSYVSGHATFSGAAATLLGAVFPSSRRELQQMAEEAAMSRLYGGIHYRFDNEQGLELGQKIGALAVAELHRHEKLGPAHVTRG